MSYTNNVKDKESRGSMKVIQGVYKITNLVDNKIYVGISNDIWGRWDEHVRDATHEAEPAYNTILSQAIRKYGIKNFKVEIIQIEDNPEKRKLLEKYYIKTLNSFMPKGYNMTIGGDGSLRNKLTKDDVIAIRNRYANLERCMVVYQDYKDRIGRSGFNKIWKGETWKHIMPEVYTPERILWNKMHTGNSGVWNGRAKISLDELKKIRDRYSKGETAYSIWQDYKNIYPSLDSFRQLVKGERWKI